MQKTQVKLYNARLSFARLATPEYPPNTPQEKIDNGEAKLRYSSSVMWEEKNPLTDAVYAAQEAAIQLGLTRGNYTKGQLKTIKKAIRSGTDEYAGGDGDRGKEYDGMLFTNAWSNRMPDYRDPYGNRITTPADIEEMFYSGAWVNIILQFAPYGGGANPGKGVGCYLGAIMFVKDGDRLDGMISGDTAFGDDFQTATEDEDDLV